MRHARSPRLVLLLALAMACDCRTKPQGGPEPVAECQEYQAAFARCTGVDAAIATQPEALASTKEQRAELKELCLLNMARLKEACR